MFYSVFAVNSLLAKAIPALSPPAGINAVGKFNLYGERNINISTLKNNGWPRSGGDYGTRWLHGDFRDVAYFYTYELFDNIVNIGDLK